MVVNIASTHCAYPQRDGQAELAWVTGYVLHFLTIRKNLGGLASKQRLGDLTVTVLCHVVSEIFNVEKCRDLEIQVKVT